MSRRITWLIPMLAMLTLSGCISFPHDGWHHRHYDGGPGYYYHRQVIQPAGISPL
ncbi:hypothetical protein [Pseudomonas chlororaphis]|uniref:hypothetical protein n=1 Tax=Pseudomonas chlororaphis TaxID=587753 RepID=UPI0015DF718F|nr:hypothetical protein [Pseudomonas chlororaphis]QLL10934.1 hypothetical protein H0I86_17915 [Pseudomonas chlororaphis subsp. aurantiaca]